MKRQIEKTSLLLRLVESSGNLSRVFDRSVTIAFSIGEKLTPCKSGSSSENIYFVMVIGPIREPVPSPLRYETFGSAMALRCESCVSLSMREYIITRPWERVTFKSTDSHYSWVV